MSSLSTPNKSENDYWSLDRFQHWMQQQLLNPMEMAHTVESVINHSDRLPAREHLAIYQRSYINRLRHCMAQQFSALEYALGEDVFRAFADDYLIEHPSHHYNLSVLGAKFSDHMEATRPDLGEQEKENWIDFMIELARFEYEVGLIFEERAEENYRLANESDSEEKLQLIPVFYVFQHQFPISRYYTAFKNDEFPTLPGEQTSYCVVLRHQYKLAIYELRQEQFDFLRLLKEGLSVPEAKEVFKKKYAAAAISFDPIWPIWKARWISAKFFRR